MAKKLIIAEKPSVANDIARAIGGFTRHGDYYESDDFVLSSAIGHLLELTAPEAYEVKRGKWSLANLPVIPPHFDLKPIERNEERLKLLVRLMKRKDVTALINACDAGREGELIFRYIVRHAETKKPIQRLWLQSMTPASIRDGFEALRTDRELQPLADAAVCRSESDWLVGINGTRAMTAFNSKDGGFYKTTVGRVQTPTLAVLVERERRIKSFVTRDYWEVHGTFAGKGGEYPRPLVRRALRAQGRRRRRARGAALGPGARRGDPREMPRQARHRHRGVEADHPGPAAALRPHEPAARGERPLRVLGARDALARAGAVREAQGADLPADRFARAAGGLRRHGEEDARHAGRQERADARLCPVRRPASSTKAGSGRTSACSTTRRSPITSRSSRRCRRPSTSPRRRQSSTTW